MNTTISAYERAQRFYEDHVGDLIENDINEILTEYEGYLFVKPDRLLLGWRIEDGWFIRMAIGRGLQGFAELLPYQLKYVGWARVANGRNSVHWYKLDAVLRKIRYAKQNTLEIMPDGSVDPCDVPSPAGAKIIRPDLWRGRITTESPTSSCPTDKV